MLSSAHILFLFLSLWALTTNAFFAYCPTYRCGEQDSLSSSSSSTTALADSSEGASASSLTSSSPAVPPPATPGKPLGAFQNLTLKLTERGLPPATSHPKRAAREAARLIHKFARFHPAPQVGQHQPITTITTTTPPALRKRKSVNQYTVALPETPQHPNSVGIIQDGTDFSYFAEVRLGSSNKPLYMLTDTGAGTSWVMGSECNSPACKLHESFGTPDSSSLKTSTKSFRIGYSTGSVKGSLATDRVSIADISVDLEFGIAREISDEFNNFPFDGILGFARNGGNTAGLLDTVSGAKLLDKNIYSFYLARASDGPNAGELSFGSTNPAKYTGDITYTNLTTSDSDWLVNLDGISFGDKQVVDGMPAYVDTGTTYMFGPPDAVHALHEAIPGATTADNVTYSVPCDVASVPRVTLSGVSYGISKVDWLSSPNNDNHCTSNIYGIEVVPGSWLLGGTFLKNVYAVFDDDNARLGLANRAPASAVGPSSTSNPNGITTPNPSLGLDRPETSSVMSTDDDDTQGNGPNSVPSSAMNMDSLFSGRIISTLVAFATALLLFFA